MVPVRNALKEFSDSSGPKMHLKFKQSFYRKLFAKYARAAQEYCDSKDKVLYHLLVCGLLKVLYDKVKRVIFRLVHVLGYDHFGRYFGMILQYFGMKN